MAEGAFNGAMGKLAASAEGPLNCDVGFPRAAVSAAGMSCGLVVQHDEGSALVRIAFRATKLPGTLLAMPIFYTEVRFQGIME